MAIQVQMTEEGHNSLRFSRRGKIKYSRTASDLVFFKDL